MDRVCRKLGSRPGERVVEAGCGWGSLALFMARHYGVHGRAPSTSRAEQIALRARAARATKGSTDRVEFVEDDYRNVRGPYDAFVSVGMLEHVGAADYPTLGEVIDRSLTDRGRGLLHFIGRNQPAPLNPWIRKRIFPGAYPPDAARGVRARARAAGPVGARRREPAAALREDARALAATLRDAAAGDVAAMFDETFVRAWRLYLAGSQAAFIDRLDAAVPGRVRARRQQRHSLDARLTRRIASRTDGHL